MQTIPDLNNFKAWNSKWALIPILACSVSVHKAGIYLYARWREVSPLEPRHSLWHIGHCPLQSRSAAPRSTSESCPSSTRHALRTKRNSNNPPWLRAFRRGEIHMLRNTNRIKNSEVAKWEGHLKSGKRERARSHRLWSLAKEAA